MINVYLFTKIKPISKGEAGAKSTKYAKCFN